MQRIVMVFLGGGLGATLRYLLTIIIGAPGGFPLGILTINAFGSLLIGFLSQILSRFGMHDSYLIYLLMIGLLGGFTTFSSFSLDTINLFLADKVVMALFYILLSVLFSLLAAYLGVIFAKVLI